MSAVAGWFAQWLAMGGYAGFVWPAYGLAAAVLGGLALYSWRRHRLSGDMLAGLQRPPPYPPAQAGEGRVGGMLE